jgi:NADPH:quinone reductase-like Zn-dependent oxidoreductase
MFIAKQRAGDLEEIRSLIETGAVTPAIDRIFSLDQAPEAMRYLEAGSTRGKIAISM